MPCFLAFSLFYFSFHLCIRKIGGDCIRKLAEMFYLNTVFISSCNHLQLLERAIMRSYVKMDVDSFENYQGLNRFEYFYYLPISRT